MINISCFHSDVVRVYFPEISKTGVDIDCRGHRIEVKEEQKGFFCIKSEDVRRSTWILFYSHSHATWCVVVTKRLKGGRSYRPSQIFRLAYEIFTSGDAARAWFDSLVRRQYRRPDDWMDGGTAAEAW